ncbi:MAG: hypothetical protein ACLFMZ_12060, partial [Spirochaetaceae bacterium]
EQYGPLVLRSKREGDCIKTAAGDTKLTVLYGKLGISAENRWKYPVVEDRRGILALLNIEDCAASFVGLLGEGEAVEGCTSYLIASQAASRQQRQRK